MIPETNHRILGEGSLVLWLPMISLGSLFQLKGFSRRKPEGCSEINIVESDNYKF